MEVTERELQQLEELARRCDPAPWQAVVEGRDQVAGDSFIQTGLGGSRGEDIYVTRDSGPAGPEYLDLIAASRTYLPMLIEEIRHLRSRQRSDDV